MNGYWKWIATTAVGIILVLMGGVIQRAWTDRELSIRMDGIERQILQLSVTVSGDSGYGSRIADHENRLREVERTCP